MPDDITFTYSTDPGDSISFDITTPSGGGGGGAPSGPAGGDLGGTYPNPSVPGLADKANTADLATVATSGAYTDLSGKPTIPTTAAEVGADVAGAAAAAQAASQPLDSDLTAIAALTTTSYGRGLLALADATAARTAVGAEAAGAAAAAQAYAIQRANHTGTQAQSTVSGLEASLAVGNRMSCIGDSVMAGQAGSGGATFTLAAMLSMGQIQFVSSRAVSGASTATGLSVQVPQVITDRPDWCLVVLGVNDFLTAQATSIANLKAIYSALVAAGIRPVLATATPRTGYASVIEGINQFVRAWGAKNRWPVIDLHAAVVEPLTGVWKASLTTDALHPNPAGTRVLAQTIADGMATVLGAMSPMIARINADANWNMITSNALLTADTNADGVPDGWAGTNVAGVTPSLVTGTWGNFFELNRTNSAAATTYYESTSITTGFTTGDRIAATGRIQAEAEAGSLRYEVFVTLNGVANRVPISHGSDIADGVFYYEDVVPVGGVRLRLQSLTGGTGKVRIGQVAIRNLTKLGI